MRKTAYLVFLLALLTSFKGSEENFTGKILYQYQFTDLSGKDITEQLAAYVGREQHYFINDKNYKAYDEKGNLMQLYNSETNTYYVVGKDKSAEKMDAATATSQNQVVKQLSVREKIAGYDCKALQIETETGITIYYYSPLIKVDPKVYSRHNLGDWNKYMEASKGSLPLKHVVTNTKQGYIWTATAVQVEKVTLQASDFALPEDITVK